jgi:hypothetical protein
MSRPVQTLQEGFSVRVGKNAKEPDVVAEFFLFFKEDLRAHQALSPVAFVKGFVPFSSSNAHRPDGDLSMWVRGCTGSAGSENLHPLCLIRIRKPLLSGFVVRANPVFSVYSDGGGKAMSPLIFLRMRTAWR